MTESANEKQIRMMHIVNLISIAYADGSITQNEHELLEHIAQRWDLTEEEFNNCVEYWKGTDEADIPIAVPEDDDEGVAFLKDFTLLMMIDGEIEENEKKYLANVAEQFGYDPEKVVPQLIDIVYNEHFADNEEEGETEDDLFEDTDDESQISMGKMELEGKNVESAFDELFLPALRNGVAYAYFHNIPGVDTRLFRLTDEQLELVQRAADQGYAVAYYVMGRYHQVVKPEDNSLEKARQYLESAAQAGIPDAQWALAMRYLLGYQGPVEIDEFNRLIDQAIDGGSMMALRQRLHDTIHGRHGQKADPKTTIRQIEAFMAQDDDNATKYPYMYDLLGDAYRKVGNKDKADACYEQAEDHGYYESGASRFLNKIEGPDKDFYRETLSVLLDFSCDNQDPNSFLTRALENAYHYDKEEKAERKADWTAKTKEDLETAFKLGSGDAAAYLGRYYYEGSHGFEKNDSEAWAWFDKGQYLESGLAFAGMARMVEDGVKPDNLPDNYLEYLKRCASLRCDEGQANDTSNLPTVVVVNPDGQATIYKVEKAEWTKLPHLIGAKRLAPVRMDALDKLGKEAGLTDRLVAWVDIDAPRKGLPVNPTANLFHKGVIAGDIVFTMADRLFEPVMFFGIDEAKTVVEALDVALSDVVTDLSKVSDERQKPIDYSKVNPKADQGYVARIEPDGTAHIVNSGLGVFALFEEDIYDPARLQSLYDLGAQLGLKGRLTLWTDNSALRKQMVMDDKITPNPIGAKWYPGPVADNLFVALEDEGYRMMLFDDVELLKKTCMALGIKENNIIIE